MKNLLKKISDNNILLEIVDGKLKVFAGDRAISPELLTEIKTRKEELTRFLTANNQVEFQASFQQSIPRAALRESYPMSSSQFRLWVMSQMDEASLAFNMTGVFSLEGKLDIHALEQAFLDLTERHEVLRTVFRDNESGTADQIIHPLTGVHFNIPCTDMRKVKMKEQAIEQTIQLETEKIFDLKNGPLIRASLLQVDENKWIFIYVMHHIISDGWSMNTLIDELLVFYKARHLQEKNPLTPLNIQYKDYSVWQQNLLKNGQLKHHKEYWLNQFSGELPVLELSSYAARPTLRTYNGKIIQKTLSPVLAAQFKSATKQQGATLFMGLLASLNTLLFRYTNQEDIIIGSPIAGREHTDLEGQIGFYVNTLALRSRFSSEDSFNTLLAKVRQLTLDAYEHQSYPFDELVNELNIRRDLSRNVLFDVGMGLQNSTKDTSGGKQNMTEVMVSAYQSSDNIATEYDLLFEFEESADSLELTLTYNRDIHNHEFATQLILHLEQIMEQCIASPTIPLNQLDYLSAVEKSRILADFNNTALPYPQEKTLITLFGEQVNKTPENCAIVFENRQFTYAELNALVNQFAAFLTEQHKIVAHQRVGICLERSEWMLIAILAILKVRGAYLPIDPEYPEDRLKYILEDSACEVLIDAKQIGNFIALKAKYSTNDSKAEGNPSDIAYVIYTSGSTGKPKGVLISHRNAVNFFTGMNALVGTEPGTLLAVTNYTFDISVLELLWTLTLGYKVIILRDVMDIGKDVSLKNKTLDFSLFYFGNADQSRDLEKYKLLIEGAKYADQNGYCAVWTPERHFHEFGGLYPNPSVMGAAISSVTKQIKIRAGSVVLPLHNPLRIAEEWSLVDNLSGGRVGIACASGWHPNDFVLAPENYKNRQALMFEHVETIKKLWNGEAVDFKDGEGVLKDTRIFPVPIQKELPLWITSGGSIETFKSAGRIGANVLTHLLGENIEELEVKIKAYRQAYTENGHEAGKGKVTLMLHTYLGEDLETAMETARKPFVNYLRTEIRLLKGMARSLGVDMDSGEFTAKDLDDLLNFSFTRYANQAGLIGTRETCQVMLDKVKQIGVDEVACLIDFGVDFENVMKSLSILTKLKESNQIASEDYSLLGQIKNHGVTHMQSTPSLAGLLNASSMELNSMHSLKKLLLGGEKLPLTLMQDLYKKIPGIEILNMYGPTETTIWSTSFATQQDTEKILIGKPIANTQIYILDKAMQIVPPGVSGEIHIGGMGVANGYLNGTELTAERFISNPELDGGRIYKTGDFGKWLPDGNIEYLGRKDEQIKVRGHRIELGEIESALQTNPFIETSAVVVFEDANKTMNLVAYIVGKKELNIAEVRTALAEQLPAYMIPSAFVQLDSFPLTPNGKTDRKSLPDPKGLGMVRGNEYLAPRNETEEKLAAIWSEILETEKVGAKDNFFELGGQSLNTIRLFSRISKEFNVDIKLGSLFKYAILEEQAALILRTKSSVLTEIVPVPLAAHYQLSSAQSRLWVLCQFEEASKAYNMPGAFLLEGELNLKVLEASFNTLIQRHEILRTVFRQDESGEIRQFVCPSEKSHFSLSYSNLENDTQAKQNTLKLLNENVERSFDLASGPLLRASLIKTKAETHILTFCMHHIISDGWSIGIIINELLVLYTAYTKGLDSPLTPVKIHYKDYAAWQQNKLHSEESNDHRKYWLDQFKGELPVLDIYSEKSRPAIKTYEGGIITTTINADLSKKLKELCQKQGGTLFMGMLAALNALFYKYTNQEDITIGTPIAGREHIGFENQIGLYVNTLALRTQFQGSENFIDLFQKVKGVTLGAYEHQMFPFDNLVDELHLKRDLSRNPLFDILLVGETDSSQPFTRFNAGSVKVSGYDAGEDTTTKFDLRFEFNTTENEITGTIDYSTAIYSKEFVNTLILHFIQLLEDIVLHPEKPLEKLNILSQEEQKKILWEFNDTANTYDTTKTLQDLFEEQALRTPENIAVSDGMSSLTYAQLNARSNALALHLSKMLKKEDEYIAIHLERTVEMVVSILAILKTGKAYAPVEPSVPSERKRSILKSLPCSILLTDQLNLTLSEDLSDLNLSIVNMEGPFSELPISKRRLKTVKSLPEDKAYVIFTSGSTGVPKGVVVQHKPVVNLIEWVNKQFKVNEKDVLLCTASISFDLSVYDIFGILSAGGRIRIASHKELKAPELLTEIIYTENITFWDSAPVALQQLIPFLKSKDTPESAASLRLVFLSGDWIPLTLPAEIKTAFPSAEVVALGGATEATVWSNFFRVEKIKSEWKSIPYGRPIQNARYYILNNSLQPVPIGACGDLFIGGEVLAKGYNDAELTAKKFIPNPFISGERIYHTGDKARFFTDGNMEFLGRVDDQVKIRGYRIELGDIESALLVNELIDAAVVLAKGADKTEKSLVAYLISKEELNTSVIRAFLMKRLPPYMLPAYYVQLKQMPLTSNGKLDKKSLPDPAGLTLSTGYEYVAPVTERQIKLVEMWSQTLGIEKDKLSIRDNFFELGGHSIKAMFLTTRMNKEFSVNLHAAVIFNNPSIEEIAEEIDKILWVNEEAISTVPKTEEETISV